MLTSGFAVLHQILKCNPVNTAQTPIPWSWLVYIWHSTSNNHFNPLNAKLNSIWYLLALLGAHPILHISRIRVNCATKIFKPFCLFCDELGPPQTDRQTYTSNSIYHTDCLCYIVTGLTYGIYAQADLIQRLYAASQENAKIEK